VIRINYYNCIAHKVLFKLILLHWWLICKLLTTHTYFCNNTFMTHVNHLTVFIQIGQLFHCNLKTLYNLFSTTHSNRFIYTNLMTTTMMSYECLWWKKKYEWKRKKNLIYSVSSMFQFLFKIHSQLVHNACIGHKNIESETCVVKLRMREREETKS
jgi:hypothetical protein